MLNNVRNFFQSKMSVRFVMLHFWFRLDQIDPVCNLRNSYEVCTLRVNIVWYVYIWWSYYPNNDIYEIITLICLRMYVSKKYRSPAQKLASLLQYWNIAYCNVMLQMHCKRFFCNITSMLQQHFKNIVKNYIFCFTREQSPDIIARQTWQLSSYK